MEVQISIQTIQTKWPYLKLTSLTMSPHDNKISFSSDDRLSSGFCKIAATCQKINTFEKHLLTSRQASI